MAFSLLIKIILSFHRKSYCEKDKSKIAKRIHKVMVHVFWNMWLIYLVEPMLEEGLEIKRENMFEKCYIFFLFF